MLFYDVQIKERPYPSVNIREKASISKAGLEGGGGEVGWGGIRFQRGEEDGISMKLGAGILGGRML